MTFIPTHAQQLVIIQWMDSCKPKEEEELSLLTQYSHKNKTTSTFNKS